MMKRAHRMAHRVTWLLLLPLLLLLLASGGDVVDTMPPNDVVPGLGNGTVTLMHRVLP